MSEKHNCNQSDRLDRIESKIENLEGIRDVVTRLATLTEVQLEQNKERDSLIKELSSTLVEVKECVVEQKKALEIMNRQMQKTDTKVEVLDKKIMTQKLEDLKENSFNVMKFINTKVIPFLLGAGVLYVIANHDKFLK